jgi:uncharacterized membrane protein HdeD (DUF308 family)
MITFGYKNKFSGLIRASLAIVIGLVMILNRTNAVELVARIIAVVLFATGIVTLVLGLKAAKKDGESHLMIANAGFNMLMGVLLYCFASHVVNVLVVLIGLVLLIVGIFQIVALLSAVKVFKLGAWSFVMPVLVLIAGGLLVARPSFIGEAIGIVAGVSLVLYGASELISTLKMRKAIEEYEINQAPKEETKENQPKHDVEAEDVEFVKVDEQ